jgi:hypothetical protein
MDNLDNFSSLNPFEQLFADDNISEVEKLDLNFGPRFSEICAFHGSSKCLDYLVEGGFELSPLLNLYRLKRGDSVFPHVSHPDDLYCALIYGRYKQLPGSLEEACIAKPSIRTALLTLIKLVDKHAFDMEDYPSMIYPLYTPQEWSVCVSRCESNIITLLIKLELYDLFNGSQLSHKATLAVSQATHKERKELAKRCSLPITYLLYKGRRQKRDPVSRKLNNLMRRKPVSECKSENQEQTDFGALIKTFFEIPALSSLCS